MLRVCKRALTSLARATGEGWEAGAGPKGTIADTRVRTFSKAVCRIRGIGLVCPGRAVRAVPFFMDKGYYNRLVR